MKDILFYNYLNKYLCIVAVVKSRINSSLCQYNVCTPALTLQPIKRSEIRSFDHLPVCRYMSTYLGCKETVVFPQTE